MNDGNLINYIGLKIYIKNLTYYLLHNSLPINDFKNDQ